MIVLVALLHAKGWSKYNAFHVCITSYNIAVQDHRAFKQKKWKYLVLDEVCKPPNMQYLSYTPLYNTCTCMYMCFTLVCPGSEHQELQEPALANTAYLQQSASAAPDGHTATEQPHGVVVPDALPHAHRLCLSLRLQRVVLQPPHWNGRRQSGVQ